MRKYIWFLLGVLISGLFAIPAHAADQCGDVTYSPSPATGSWFTGTQSGSPKFYVLGIAQSFANCDNYLSAGVNSIITTDGTVTADYWKVISPHLYTYDHCYSNIFTVTKYDIDPSATYVGACVTEPATCTDGVVSGDETGIDCGDPACTGDEECTVYCPDGFHAEERDAGGGFMLTYCYADDDSDYVTPAKLGVCPSSHYESVTDPDLCVEGALPTWADEDYLETPTAPPVDDTPWNEQENTTDTTVTTDQTIDLGVTTDTVETVTVQDNADGSATTTTNTEVTVTQPDGSKTVTTTIDTVTRSTSGSVSGVTRITTDTYDMGGDLTGSGTVETEIESEPGAGGRFSGVGLEGSERGDGSGIDFSPITTAFDGAMGKFPFSVVSHVEHSLDSWVVEPQTPVIEFSMPIIRPEPFLMDLYLIDPLATFFRALMAFGATIMCAWAVIRTWRG